MLYVQSADDSNKKERKYIDLFLHVTAVPTSFSSNHHPSSVALTVRGLFDGSICVNLLGFVPGCDLLGPWLRERTL
jgi:hypothetical protein